MIIVHYLVHNIGQENPSRHFDLFRGLDRCLTEENRGCVMEQGNDKINVRGIFIRGGEPERNVI